MGCNKCVVVENKERCHMSHAIIVTNGVRRRDSHISAARLILDTRCQSSIVVTAECLSAFNLLYMSWDTSCPDKAIQFIDAVCI